jgi:tetratricopeptide (TPR) repeat protein
VTGAAALVLTALGALAVGLVAVNQERARTLQAYGELAREQERTEAALQQADHHLKQLRQAVDTMVTRIAGNKRLSERGFQELRHELLKYLVPFYEEFTKQQQNDPELEAERGAAFHRLAFVRAELGETHQAVADYEQMRVIFAGLAAQHPDVPQYRQELANSHNNLGNLLRDLGKRAEAEVAHRAALKLREELAAQHPELPRYRQDLAASHNNLGVLLYDLGRSAEAEVAYRAALKLREELAAQHPAVPEYRQDLARSHNGLGALLYQLGKLPESEAACRAAVKLQEELAAQHPAVLKYRQDLAISHLNLGNLLGQLGRSAEAEAAYRAALKLQEELAAQHPELPEYRQELATSHNNLGTLLKQMGRRAETAAAAYRAALKLQEELVAQYPAVPAYRQGLARSHNNLGALLADLGQRPEAEAAYRAALKLREELAAPHPAIPDYHNDLAGTLVSLADLLRKQQNYPQARELLEQAAPHCQAALKTNPSNPDYRQVYRINRRVLAFTLTGLGEHAAAARTAEQLASFGVDPANEAYSAACVLALCVPLAEKDAQLPEAERPRQARAYADRALELLRRAVANGYQDIAHLKKNTELDPLRSRNDFQELLAELEAAAKVAQEQRARLKHAIDLANKGQHAQAAAEAAPLIEAKPASAGILYDTGCVYALCVAAVQKDAQTAAPERDQLAEDYARQAIALLRRAVQAGFTDLPHLKTNDPDLHALRGRADFQQLVAELEAKTRAAKK